MSKRLADVGISPYRTRRTSVGNADPAFRFLQIRHSGASSRRALQSLVLTQIKIRKKGADTMRHGLLEIGKDILIVVLALAVLVLAILALPEKTLTSTPWLAGILKPFAGVLGMSEASLTYTAPQTAPAVTGAARPTAISVRNLAGRQSVQYDFAVLDSRFETLGAVLGQALDSASEPQAADKTQICQALQGVSAAFRYPAALSPKTVAAWLNVEGPDTEPGQWYILSAGDETVTLYVAGESCCAFRTAVSAQTLADLLESAAPDGSFFAFEGGTKYENVDAFSLISGTAPVLPAAVWTNPCEARFRISMASGLGINPYGDAAYTDSDGNAWYTEANCTLCITPQGRATLRVISADSRFEALSDSPESRIETARALLTQIAAGTAGDARLYLTEYSQSGETAVCRFDYFLSGVPVAAEAGAAAEVRFKRASVTEASITLRDYSLTEEASRLLPAPQAAAIVSDGVELALIYTETEETVRANWKS